MKNDELDQLIKKMLDQDDQQLLKELTTTGPMERLMKSFRSKTQFLNVVMIVMTFVFVGLAVFCAIRYFDTESTKAAIGWATGFLGCWISVGFLKLYQFADIDRNLILRELKKIEFRIASGENE